MLLCKRLTALDRQAMQQSLTYGTVILGNKSDRKKKLIQDTARAVFMERGFKDVTMKDIAEACQISRGGLYLYYPSTKELLRDVLRMESADSDDTFQAALSDNLTPSRILLLFLREQKKELMHPEQTLNLALYEYAFTGQEEDKAFIKKRFQQAVQIIEHLIRMGNETGEFDCPNPHDAATDIMLVIEGMKISAHTMGISERKVDREIRYLIGGLLPVEAE